MNEQAEFEKFQARVIYLEDRMQRAERILAVVREREEAADIIAAVRQWAEKTEYLGYADDYSHGLVKAQLEILAILDGRNGVRE